MTWKIDVKYLDSCCKSWLATPGSATNGTDAELVVEELSIVDEKDIRKSRKAMYVGCNCLDHKCGKEM